MQAPDPQGLRSFRQLSGYTGFCRGITGINTGEGFGTTHPLSHFFIFSVISFMFCFCKEMPPEDADGILGYRSLPVDECLDNRV